MTIRHRHACLPHERSDDQGDESDGKRDQEKAHVRQAVMIRVDEVYPSIDREGRIERWENKLRTALRPSGQVSLLA